MRKHLSKKLSTEIETAAWDVIKKMVDEDVYHGMGYSRQLYIIRSFIHLAIQGEVSKFNTPPPLDPLLFVIDFI